MLKKATIGVLAFVTDLRADKLGRLRAVSAHVLRFRSVRPVYSAEVSSEGREGLRPCWVTFLTIPVSH